MTDELFHLTDRILTISEVVKITGKSKATILRDEKEGTFPLRRKTGVSSRGFLQSEIMNWIKTRPPVSKIRNSRIKG